MNIRLIWNGELSSIDTPGGMFQVYEAHVVRASWPIEISNGSAVRTLVARAVVDVREPEAKVEVRYLDTLTESDSYSEVFLVAETFGMSCAELRTEVERALTDEFSSVGTWDKVRNLWGL